MAFVTFTPPVRQSPGTKNTPEIKLLQAAFGDGYTQDGPDGSNNVRDVVSLSWNVLTEADAQTIFDFLMAHTTVPFYYAMTGNTTKKWTAKDTSRAWDTPNTVTSTFRQSFIYDA